MSTIQNTNANCGYSDIGKARALNSAFVDKIMRGQKKEAAVSLTSFIRKKIREESFLENILTPQPITEDQLDKDVDLDRLRKIVELEPDSEAMPISFLGDPPNRILKQEAVELKFYEIATDKVKKNIYQLKTRDNDVRKIISDNHVKDMAAVQDSKFIQACDAAVAANPLQQNRQFNGGLTKINFVESMKMLTEQELANAIVLMNNTTAKELLKWDSTDIGYEPVSEQYKRGLTCGDIMGLKLITTIKRNIVKDNQVYFFTPEDFLGKFYMLQDSTVYVEQKYKWIEFQAYKVLAAGLINTKAVAKATYVP